jgi:hypothetical protein
VLAGQSAGLRATERQPLYPGLAGGRQGVHKRTQEAKYASKKATDRQRARNEIKSKLMKVRVAKQFCTEQVCSGNNAYDLRSGDV